MGSNRKISLFEDLVCQVNFSSHLASSMETPTFKNISEKQSIISEGKAQFFDQSVVAEIMPETRCNLKSVTDKIQEDLVDFDSRKRPSPGDDLSQPPPKREKFSDLSKEDISFRLSSNKASNNIDPSSVSEMAVHRETCTDDVLHDDTSGSSSSLSWASSNTIDEDYRLDLPFNTVSSPHLVHRKDEPDVFTFIPDLYPRKSVALGPSHQADIPEWRPRHAKILTYEEDADEKRLMGACIIPMPHDDYMSSFSSPVSTDCNCHDSDPIKCNKIHLMDARERLKRCIGLNKFVDLGFPDMGESVASRWTEEEERIFREVVDKNPASLGENFWNYLPKYLPSKTSKDLVSYYFNVFILRKRAEQNRSEPLNVDSDNDEWQECDFPAKTTDEHDFYDDDIHDEDEEIHESCTSFEGQGIPTVAERRCEDMNGMVDHGYLVSPDMKPWDMGYFSGQENSVDFLPTCHVIEVFGEGSWVANKTNDDENII